jgi:hypothetical protein
VGAGTLPAVARALVRDRRVALAGIVLLAAAVRLAGAGDRLSADEGYSWLVASAPDAGAFLGRLAAYENTPPLFYLLLTPLPLDDEVWLRLPALLASTAAVPVLYAIVRPLLGTAPALLGALALAVAPYHVSFANYSRAFMLAGLGLLVALWGAARLAQGGPRRWWWTYAAGAAVALYSEYDTGLALVAIVGALLVTGVPPRRQTLVLGALPALALVPWLPELADSLSALDETKVAPVYPSPGPAALRDVAVPLAFGEHGAASSSALRTLQFLALAAVLAFAGAHLWRRERPAFWLLAGPGLGTLALAALVAGPGPDVFAQRYLTLLIPLGAAVAAAGVAALPGRAPVALAALGLVAVGAAVFATREGRELEPDPGPVVAAVASAGPRVEVHTNSATLAYYMRGLPVVLDRPFGLRAPLLRLGEACEPPPCTIVAADDTRVAGGPRPGAGPQRVIGPFVVRVQQVSRRAAVP